MMAHSPGYPTDNNRQPDGKERSREKQRGSRHGSRDEEAPHLGKRDLYIRYSNTQYNNYFNLTVRAMLDDCSVLADSATMQCSLSTQAAEANEVS